MGKPIADPNRISVAEASRRLGMTRESFCQCMIQDAFPSPVGVAFKKKGGKHYTYYVYRSKIEALEKFWGLVD